MPDLVVREPVPSIARWFSGGSCVVGAALLGAGAAPQVSGGERVLVLTLAVGVLVAAVGLGRSRAELRILPGRVRLGLIPLWRTTVAVADVAAVRVRRVEPIPREWGSRGRARGPEGLLIGVGEVRDAIEVELRDGRRYSLTLDGGRHDLEDLVRRLRAHCEPVATP